MVYLNAVKLGFALAATCFAVHIPVALANQETINELQSPGGIDRPNHGGVRKLAKKTIKIMSDSPSMSPTEGSSAPSIYPTHKQNHHVAKKLPSVSDSPSMGPSTASETPSVGPPSISPSLHHHVSTNATKIASKNVTTIPTKNATTIATKNATTIATKNATRSLVEA
jgi:hypothetical protein